MITRKLALSAVMGIAAGTFALAGPASADDGLGCVSPELAGADGYLHTIDPTTGQDVDLPACSSPTTGPWSGWREVPPTFVQAAQTAAPSPQRTEPKRITTKRSTGRRTVCGTWWARGRDAHGRGGHRAGYRGTWHVVRECRSR